MKQRVLIEKNYLRIPIRKDAVEKNVWLYQELTAVLQFQAGLFVDYGSGAPDFYAELPVERWKGSVPVSYTHLDVYKRQASIRSALV